MDSSIPAQMPEQEPKLPFTPKTLADIDRRKCQRVVPMRVLVLGLSRTGTNSLRIALEHLGYDTTYHGYSAAFENPRDCEMWLDGLKAKFHGKGAPFGRHEFNQLLGHCQAVSDVPAVCFAPELIRAYPEAKVILTIRDVDSWYNSVMRSLISRIYNPKAAILAKLAWLTGSTGRWTRPTFTMVFDEYFRHFPTNGKAVFHEHHAMIRRLVPKDNLLEYNIKDGWEPLCEFLEQPVPDMVFPRTNDDAETGLMIKHLTRYETKKALRRLGFLFVCLLSLLIIVLVAWLRVKVWDEAWTWIQIYLEE